MAEGGCGAGRGEAELAVVVAPGDHADLCGELRLDAVDGGGGHGGTEPGERCGDVAGGCARADCCAEGDLGGYLVDGDVVAGPRGAGAYRGDVGGGCAGVRGVDAGEGGLDDVIDAEHAGTPLLYAWCCALGVRSVARGLPGPRRGETLQDGGAWAMQRQGNVAVTSLSVFLRVSGSENGGRLTPPVVGRRCPAGALPPCPAHDRGAAAPRRR